MVKGCLICERIDLIKMGKNPYFVKELKTGYVVVGDHQYFLGYTLLLGKKHVNELHELPKNFRQKFLNEMSMVAEAVFRAFKPDKLNYELLGNKDTHMHWHIFPRYKSEPNFGKPVWTVDKKNRMSEKVKPSSKKLASLKKALLKYL